MKAVDFIKKFGWDWAKELTIKHENCYMPKTFNYWSNKLQDFVLCTKYASFEMSELKQYIDAWELTQVHGLEQSKEIVKNAPSDYHFYSWTLGNSGIKDKTVNIGELRKAIALVEEVESLKEVGNENQNQKF